jgi:single-stranded DNA-binding protein
VAVSGIETAFFGVLGRDAESKVSGAGKSFVRLNVRVGDGEGAQWVGVMVFDPDAIALADNLTKGARVYVEGRLSVSEWTGSDGAKRHGLSVMSWHCRLSQIGRNKPKRKSDREATAPYAPGNGPAFYDDNIPFATEVR